MSRKVVCYIATSADGFIARKDGGFDWLEKHSTPAAHSGYNDFIAGVDTVVWGRSTWDQMLPYLDGAPSMGDATKNYVFTSHPETAQPRPNTEFLNEQPKTFMDRMRAAGGKNIWMMGGGGIIASFLDAGEMDEFIIHVVPVFIGEGIPLIAPRHREIPLRLLDTKRYDDVVMLHYAVVR